MARRQRVESHIYVYPNGRYLVRVAGVRPTWFPPTTTIKHMRGWIAEQQKDRDQDRRAFGELTPQAQARARGTLEGDAPSYLQQIAGRVSAKADASHLRAWFDVVVPINGKPVRLGALARHAWTTAHVNVAIAQWQTMPSPHAIRKVRVRGYTRPEMTVASFAIAPATVRAHARIGAQAAHVSSYTRKASVVTAHTRPANTVGDYVRTAPATSGRVVAALTIRHRCRVLQDLFRTLDGPKAPTPVDDAKVPKRDQTPPAIVPPETVARVIETLARGDAKDFARFFLFAVTAQRPCQIGRAQPGDVSLEERTWLVRSAKGEPAHLIALNDQQLSAWRVFIAADAWGTIDTTKYGKRIHTAGWPKGIRPYNARHSLAVDAINRGVSLGDLQGLLGHSSPETTRRFYAPFQLQQQRAVSTQMNPYLADVLKPRLVR